jgi:hypothetical protein
MVMSRVSTIAMIFALSAYTEETAVAEISRRNKSIARVDRDKGRTNHGTNTQRV